MAACPSTSFPRPPSHDNPGLSAQLFKRKIEGPGTETHYCMTPSPESSNDKVPVKYPYFLSCAAYCHLMFRLLFV